MHLEGGGPPRPSIGARVAQVLGLQGASVEVRCPEGGSARTARLVMVVHPLLESRMLAAVELIAGP